MKIKIIACGVFQPYLESMLKSSNNQVDLAILDAGLHENPNELRINVQKEIDIASKKKSAGHNDGNCKTCPNPCKKYDLIVIFYGLCGGGTLNLSTRNIPVLIPRVHDCISLFLGSNLAYKKEFSSNPGTFYHTLGWISNKINPKNKDAKDLYINYDISGWDVHPDFNKLEEKFGKDNAEYILKFGYSWTKNYTRSAYIDLNFNEDSFEEITKFMARTFNWNYEKINGDAGFIKSLFNGTITDSAILIPPFSMTKPSGNEKIFTYVSDGVIENQSPFYEKETIVEKISHEKEIKGIGLGIDAGGTYTDAVIYDFSKKMVLAKAKSPTTYNDLLIGIKNALLKLPINMLEQVNISSLSTTLATNYIVEGKGYKVGAIIYSPFDWFEKSIEHSPTMKVKGALDISGKVLETIDPDEIEKTVKYLIEEKGSMALAIGGYGSIRNPELSNKIKDIAQQMYPNIPIITSHELSNKLNAINSVRTAIANARLIPVIQNLITAVKKVLNEFGIKKELMIVKGDGTCVMDSFALNRPVETILSGPAASISGAKILTHEPNAIVMDVGGTTTDTAIIENNHIKVAPDGARVGNWVMQVDATEINTTGLGGDSRIDFNRDRKIILGPVRNIPICTTVSDYPYLMERLISLSKENLQTSFDACNLDILIYNNVIKANLQEYEMDLINLLKEKRAIFAIDAYKHLNLASMELLHIPKLEKIGVLKRSSLTPTDLMHISNKISLWDKESSKYALNIFSRLLGETEEEIVKQAEKEIKFKLIKEIIKKDLSNKNFKINETSNDLNFFIENLLSEDKSGISATFALNYPIIAIGAPAKMIFEGLEKFIDTKIIVPEHSDVANAIGAISGEISVKETVAIRNGATSNFILFSKNHRQEENSLDLATETAKKEVKSLVLKRAKSAGAFNPSIEISVKDHLAKGRDGSALFIERFVTGIATGSFLGK